MSNQHFRALRIQNCQPFLANICFRRTRPSLFYWHKIFAYKLTHTHPLALDDGGFLHSRYFFVPPTCKISTYYGLSDHLLVFILFYFICTVNLITCLLPIVDHLTLPLVQPPRQRLISHHILEILLSFHSNKKSQEIFDVSLYLTMSRLFLSHAQLILP